MIFVAGQHIESVEQLSRDFQQVLCLITNGYDWFNWALNEPTLSVYYAQTEQDLLMKIQNGLHETSLLRNPYFSLSIQKAIAFDDEDREALIQIFDDKNVDSTTVQAVMNKYGLISQEQLNQLPQILSSFELDTAPVFNNMSFRETLEVYAFLSKQVSPDKILELDQPESSSSSSSSGKSSGSKKKSNVSQEAVNFAITKASTPSEFVNYSRFYLACIKYQISGNTDKSLRSKIIEKLYNQLSELCFKLIYVPNIGPANAENLTPEELKNFVLESKHIGYRQRAAAMENLAKNVQIKDVSQEQLMEEINMYQNLVRETVQQGYFQGQELPQAGWLRPYSCLGDTLKVIVQVDAGGDIFLSPDTIHLKDDELISLD